MTPCGRGVIVTSLISARLYHCRFASVKQSARLTAFFGFDLPIGRVENLFNHLCSDVMTALQIVLYRPDGEGRTPRDGPPTSDKRQQVIRQTFPEDVFTRPDEKDGAGLPPGD